MEQEQINQSGVELGETHPKKGHPVALFVVLLVLLGVVLGVFSMKGGMNKGDMNETTPQATAPDAEAERMRIGKEKEAILLMVSSPTPLNYVEKQELFRKIEGEKILTYGFTSEEQVKIFNALTRD